MLASMAIYIVYYLVIFSLLKLFIFFAQTTVIHHNAFTIKMPDIGKNSYTKTFSYIRHMLIILLDALYYTHLVIYFDLNLHIFVL